MEDQQIVRLFLGRSQEALPALDRAYGRLCGQVARNILGDPRDAEECVNDAYLAVWNTVPPQRPDPLPAYVCRIVRNLAVKRWRANHAARRNSRYDTALDELAAGFPARETAESAYEARELAAAINAFLAGLDGTSRRLFVRRYYLAEPVEEAARALGLSPGQASVRLHRTRNRLKRYLRKEGLWS